MLGEPETPGEAWPPGAALVTYPESYTNSSLSSVSQDLRKVRTAPRGQGPGPRAGILAHPQAPGIRRVLQCQESCKENSAVGTGRASIPQLQQNPQRSRLRI